MTRRSVSRQRIIPAPAVAVFAMLADYRHGHPSILPGAFSAFEVLARGTGAGTRIRFRFTVAGRTRVMEGIVTEPEPGRVLSETYSDGGVTTFTVEPLGEQSRLHIETAWESRTGLAGQIEKWLVPRMLRPVYDQELDLIVEWASSGQTV